MKALVYLLNFCELFAAIIAFVYYNKVKNNYWKWFAVYLVVVVMVEFVGRFFNIIDRSTWNNYLYRFFGIPVQFLFFFWLFSKQARQKTDRLLPLISIAIYLLCWTIEILFLKGVKMWFFSFSYTVGNLLLVFLLISYLLKFINSDEILTYKTNMMFWVTVGIAIFYLGTLPFFALRNTLYYQYKDVFTIYNYIQLILGCLMYLVFALSFIWGKPR